MKTIFTHTVDILSVVGLAAFGGLTRVFYGASEGKPYPWKRIFPEIIIASFSGLIIHWAALELGMSDNMRTIAIALAGYCARSVLIIFNAVFVTFIKRNVTLEKK